MFANFRNNRRVTGISGLLIVSVAVALAMAWPSNLQANDPPLVDTIHLKNGGVLYGTAEEIVEDKQRFYLVTTTEGTILKLKRSQVDRVQKPTQEMRDYIDRKNAMVDTVDGHWEMQQWCQQNRLHHQREYHLLRIIELDPDHKDARARLNYKDFDGVWVQRDHFMSNHGYIKDGRGVPRLPVAVEMYEHREAADQVVAEWNKRIRNLMTKVVKRNDQIALKTLTEIKDPAAVSGLMKVYEDSTDYQTRKMIIDILGQIESGPSQNALVVIATTTPDEHLDLAERAVNLLRQPHFNRAGICSTVMHWLSPSPTSKLDKRLLVNRAAWLIGKMEYTPAIRSLIDALNTTHLVPTGAPGGNANVGVGNEGAGLDWGKKAQFRPEVFTNQPVLDTLRLLAPRGVDYGFDELGWTDWYIRENSLGTNRLGRDN